MHRHNQCKQIRYLSKVIKDALSHMKQEGLIRLNFSSFKFIRMKNDNELST